MSVMITNAASIEEQLATIACAIEQLTEHVKEKDLQIASLMNKLESQNIGESSQAPKHPSGDTSNCTNR